jgi:hypothetical protein
MPRVNLIVILVTYIRYLYSINCPTVICLPSMLLFILWIDATSELWTPVQFPLHCFTVLLLLALFTLLALLLSFYHSIRSILCLQQIGEIDNLIVSWDQVLGCVVCRFHVAAGEKLRADKQLIWRPCPECREASKHHLLKFGFLLLLRLNLGFTTEGRLATVLIIPSSWGFQRAVLTRHPVVFWRHYRRERRLMQGKSLTHNLLLCFCFCFCFALLYFLLFCLHLFIKNTKK